MEKSQIKLFTITAGQIVAVILSCLGTFISLTIPLTVSKIIDGKGLLTTGKNYIWQLAVLLIIGSIINAVSEYLLSVVGDSRIRRLRLRLQERLLNLPLKFFKNNNTGELISHVMNDTLVIKDFSVNVIPSAIVSLLTIIGSFAILISLDIKLTLAILITFTFIALSAYPLGKINEKYSYRIQKSLGKVSANLEENTRNIKLIKLSNSQSQVMDKFTENTDYLFSLSKKIDGIFSLTGPIQTMITLLGFLLIIMYGSMRVANHTLSIGMMTSFLMYMFEIVSPINNLGNFYLSYSEARGALKSIDQIMNVEIEDKSGKDIKADEVKNGDIVIRDLSFAYEKDSRVLEDISMTFKKGQKTALVGPSGAGKTTLINLLTRLETGYDGEITLGKYEAKECSLKSWRSLFSVVTQENNIFSGTIMDNLTFGLKKKPTDKQIQRSLEMANLTDDLMQMPEGLNTQTGESGSHLSAGQNQRLQLARACLNKAPCLILDEATANLDPESEMKVTQAIDEISKSKIVIIIAHRLSTIVNADQIYFLDNHHLQGCGTHFELMEQVPKYKAFVEDQIIPEFNK